MCRRESVLGLIDNHATIRGMLERQARERGEQIYLMFGDSRITFAQADEHVNRLANGLAALGLRHGDRVAIMLPNHPDHVFTFLACAKLGLTQVPVNAQLKGPGLTYLLAHAEPRAIIADTAYVDQLASALDGCGAEFAIWRGQPPFADGLEAIEFNAVAGVDNRQPPACAVDPDDVLSISYTSGTTGPPKGVLVTDKMFRASGYAAGQVSEAQVGEVMFLWEPLFHIGGSQVMVLGLHYGASLAIVERFSASAFWDQVRRYRATRMHYLGGILSMLLKQPAVPNDTDNPIRIAWGGGATLETWRAFEARFRVEIRENYGMTEASSLTTFNTGGRIGSVGRPAAYFDVRIVDDGGLPMGPNRPGEFIVREREPGLIMRGYFKNAKATAAALRDGWLYTGDVGAYDEDGFYYYAGRKTDSMRVRGENVSAWEVERVVNDHPAVAACAAIGVDAEIGDQDIKLFVMPRPDAAPDPLELIAWCDARLAPFQVPRYVAFVEAFPMTATERIRKEMLPRSVDDCWDLAESGYRVGRSG